MKDEKARRHAFSSFILYPLFVGFLAERGPSGILVV
jgi:hypothetical protein